MFCSNCGENIVEKAKFCTHCGAKVGTGDSKNIAKKDIAAGLFARACVKPLSPEGQKSLSILKKKFGKPELSQYDLNVVLMCKDKKVIRKIGGGAGKIEISVASSSNSCTWKEMLEKKINTNFEFKDVYFLLRKDGEEIHELKEVLHQRKKTHKKQLIIYAVLPNKRNKLVISYKKAEEKVTVSEDLPGCSTEKESEMITLSDSSSSEDSGNEFLELKTTSTLTKQNSKVEPESTSSRVDFEEEAMVPQACCSTSTTITTSTLTTQTSKVEEPLPSASSRVDSAEFEESEREMRLFFKIQTKKEERQKVCAHRIRDCCEGEKRITVIYEAHGGIGISFSFSPHEPIQIVYDYICCNIDPEILPPKFYLENNDVKYPINDLCTCDKLPDILFLKEEEYNLDATLTNYDEVFF